MSGQEAHEFDPTAARNALRQEKLLLDLLSYVPGWAVMKRTEVDRLLNEAEALRIQRDEAVTACEEAWKALEKDDVQAARSALAVPLGGFDVDRWER